MNGLVVVPGVRDLAHRSRQVTALLLRTDEEPNLAGWVGGDGGVGILGGGEDGKGVLADFGDEGEMKPEALGLCGDVATRSKCVVEELEVGLLEEGCGRSDRVRGVSDNDIVGGSVLGEELEAVTDKNPNTG